MFKTNEEIEFAFIIGFLILGTFVIFIIAFILFYKKRQNALLIAKQLKETEFENVLLKREVETIKAIQKERDRIGDDLHDDLGSRLSAIRLELEFLHNSFDTEDDKVKVAHVVDQSRQLSNIVRDVVWSLNAQYDTLDSFASYVKEYAVDFLSMTSIELKTNIDTNLPNTEMNSSIRRSLFLTIKEALNNAVKHSKADVITFDLGIDTNEQVFVNIADNGCGITKVNEFGNGLHIMKKRLVGIGGTCSIKKNKPSGTIVSLVVKL